MHEKYKFPSKAVCYSASGHPTQQKPLQIREAIENYGEMVAEKRKEAKKNKEKIIESTSVVGTKLFIGMISRDIDEHGLRTLFKSFGEIKEAFILRDKAGISKGCAFLKVGNFQVAITL